MYDQLIITAALLAMLIIYMDDIVLPMAKLASTISRDCANILGNYKVTKDGITYVVKNHRVVTCYEVQS